MARSRRKIPFPAGILSLCLLPLLCFTFLNEHYFIEQNLRALEIQTWNRKNNNDLHQLKKLIRPDFQKIILTGANDEIKLKYAEVSISELLAQPDTTRGVEFTFTDQAKYSSFVRIFDLCKSLDVPSYLSYGNKLWVFRGTPAPEEDERIDYRPVCGTRYFSIETMPSITTPEITKIQRAMAGVSMVLFGIMISLSVFRQ